MTSPEEASSPDAARFAIVPNVRACELEGELVLLDILRGEYFGLGELGTRAWQQLAAGCTVAEIARLLAPDYDVDLETLTRDLARFVADLERAGLVVAGAPAPVA